MAADGWRLTPAAERDLTGIWDYSARIWSVAQAERYLRGLSASFDTLARTPEIARERAEFDPPVRLHPHRSHLIVYRIEDAGVAIVRILHARQNWVNLLQGGSG